MGILSILRLFHHDRLPESYDNLVAYDHGFIISVSVTIWIIVKIGL